MKNIIYLLAIVLCAGLVLTSCEEENPEAKVRKLIPIRITYYGEDYSGDIIYAYDDKCNLIKISHYNDSSIMEYDIEGKLIKTIEYEESHLWRYYTYTYNSLKQVVKMGIYDNEDAEWGWINFKYDVAGNVVEKTSYDDDNLINTFCTFLYDNIGNMTSMEFYVASRSGLVPDTPYEKWTYAYDDKNHIFKYVNLPFFEETNIYNVVQKNLTLDDDDISYGIYNITYTYNEEDYPIECTENGGDEKYTIEYKEI